MNIEKIREDFPTTKELIYLATCGASPPLKPMLNEMRKAWEEKIYNGVILCGTTNMLQVMSKGRTYASNIINSDSDEIAFVRGNNDAMNIIAAMIDWKKGDNIIINDMEYAGGALPWMRQKRNNKIKVKCVKTIGGAVQIDDIIKAIDNHTKVISICHVHTANGYKNNLEELGKMVSDNEIYLVVNASQSLGAVEIDVKKMNIDFLTCSAYKWALGPPGTGLMYVRKELIENLEPPFVGIGQEEASILSPNFNYHEYNPDDLAKTARKFEYGGHQMATAVIGLVESLKYIDSIGMKNIAARNSMLLDYLVDCLKDLDVELPTWINDQSHRSSYVGFSAKIPAKTIFDLLKKQRILTITRMGYTGKELLRVAPHFFNTMEEIDTFIKTLKNFLNELIY